MKQSGELAKHGFAICLKQERHRFFPPQNTCGKFSQAEEKVVEARKNYLNRGKK
jgi:hypothetical protein